MSLRDAHKRGEEGVFRIPVDLLPDLEKRVKQINGKAKQLATPPVTLTRSGEFDTIQTSVGGRIGRMTGPQLTYRVEYVRVTGSTPVIEGWQFVAVVRHARTGNEFVQAPIKLTEDQQHRMGDYRASSRRCDHCSTNRVRNATYLLLNTERDEFKLVGSTCLKDFTGYNDPMVAARAFENIFKLFHEVNEWSRIIPRTTRTFSLIEWMAFVAQSIREDGWVPKSQSYENATANVAKVNILKWPESETPTDVDFDTAQSWIDWARAQESDGSDFMDKLLAIMNMDDGITEFDMGISAAIYASIKRSERETAKLIAQSNQGYFGAPKDKARLTLTVERKGGFTSAYGWCNVFNMTDGTNKFVYMTSKDEGMEEGKMYTMSFTVKKHEVDDYTGDKVTHINYVKDIVAC